MALAGELARGPLREKIDALELQRLRASGTIFADTRRARPRYFDGRFLAARDLVRDQNYFLVRQADIGLAAGAGVVGGLAVARGAGSSQVTIGSGHGFTPAGEMCVLDQAIGIDLNDIPTTQKLNVAFQLSRRPGLPLRTASGLFVLALRPIEFTANPVSSFPTSVEGERTTTDGDIVEGVAVTLTPFPVEGEQDLDRMRSLAAYEIFLAGSKDGVSPNTLPLAMVALRRGEIEWIDPFLVRRDVGAQQSDALGLGFSPRALREAHARQYATHLADVLDDRRRANRDFRFPAATYFQALPAAGRMPAEAINGADFSQSYFPPTVDCELALIPDDELPAVLEEGLGLPPIDLTRTGDELDAVSVTIYIPVPRSEFRGVLNSLAAVPRVLRIAAPGLLAKRRPLEILTTFRLPRVPVPPVDPVDQAWRQALARNSVYWYLRRRTLPYRADLAGMPVTLGGNEAQEEANVRESAAGANAIEQLDRVLGSATNRARGEILSILEIQAVRTSPVMLRGVLEELLLSDAPDSTAVLRVGDRYRSPDLGRGMSRLEQANPALLDEINRDFIAASRAAPELDRVGARLAPQDVPPLINDLLAAIATGNPQAVHDLILARHGGLIP